MTKEQFISLIYPEPNTGCWLWGGRFDSKGYGRLSHRGTFQTAHRQSYFYFKGEFDTKKHVLHSCDNPACVNPEHLSLGDQRQNNIERDIRGRQKTKHGEEHKLAKLTTEQVIEIRRIHNPKTNPTRKLARDFNISQGTIMKILKRVAWPHV